MWEYRGEIVKIVDGDTLVVNIDLGFKTTVKKERIRLIGVDTPELRSKSLHEKEHAQEAKQFVEKMLPVGSTVILRTEKDKKGRYGRYLARVWVEGENRDLSVILKEYGYEKKDNYEK